MKLRHFLPCLLLTGMAVTMASCSEEAVVLPVQDEMDQADTSGGKEVLLRVYAHRGDADTRTSLEHDGNGGLNCKWCEGDQLVVGTTDFYGLKEDVLTLISGGGSSEGVFEGRVYIDNSNHLTLNYLGSGTPVNEIKNFHNIDLSKQDGSLASLSSNDILTSPAFVVNSSYSSDEIIIENVALSRQVAFGHFTLDFPDDDNIMLSEGDEITITGDGLDGFRSEGTLSFYSGSVRDDSSNYTGSTSITVKKAEDGNDIYITMLPNITFAPTFTVIKNGVTYIGALASRTWNSGEYVRAGEKQGVSVKMLNKDKIGSDGKILGIKWASENVHSWIDCDKDEKDYAFNFSYIPGIPLNEQGIRILHTGNNIENGTENPYEYHYQWGRNFGFIVSEETLTDIPVPNADNLPTMGNSCYRVIEGQQKDAYYSKHYPTTFISSSNTDWCSSTLSSWPIDKDSDGCRMAVTPIGFRLPTKEDFQKLLPTGNSGEKFTAKTTFTVNGETIRPVCAKKTEDSTTVVWTIVNSTTNNYMALYEFAGSYTLEELTEDLFENKVLDSIKFSANGYRGGSGYKDWSLYYYKSDGYYWTGNQTRGLQDALRFSIEDNDLTVNVIMMMRKQALSLRCIYEE